MNKFRQGQTVYLITNNAFQAFNNNVPVKWWYEQHTVTNDPMPPEFCVAFYKGRVSRHWLNIINCCPNELQYITRSRRAAARRARILNQCEGAAL